MGNVTRLIRQTSVKRRQQLILSAILLAPLIIILAVFLGWPLIWTFVLSFTDLQLTGATAENWSFIGLDNFITLFEDEAFFNSVWLSTLYFLGSAFIGQCMFGFLLALLLEGRRRWIRAAVGGIIVLAWVIPEIVAAYLWFALLSDGGVLHTVLKAIGVQYDTWLISHPMLSVNLANAWRGVAFSMMIFTAAIANIAPEIKEAAVMDGASSWRRTISITIPMISGSILINLVLITLATLNNFTLIFGMTGGGPGNNSEVLSVLMYQKAFGQYQLAYGSSISVVILILATLFSIVYMKILRNRNEI